MQRKNCSAQPHQPGRRFGIRSVRIAAGLAAALFLTNSAAAMTFQRLDASLCDGRACILAAGPIEADTVRRFKAFEAAQRLPADAIVLLDSQGGNMAAGMDLGRAIRAAGFSTAVRGYDHAGRQWTAAECSSSCVWAFLGGLRRSVGPSSKIGVHQVRFEFITATGVADAQMLMGLASVYLKTLGVSQDVLTLALTTPPDHMRWLSEDEIRRYAIAS